MNDVTPAEPRPGAAISVVEALLEDPSCRDIPFVALFPSLSERTGPIDVELVPNSCRSAIGRNAREWETLREQTVASVEQWPHVGPTRARTVVSFVVDIAAQRTLSTDLIRDLRLQEFWTHVQILVAWSIARCGDGSLRDALSFVESDDVPASVTNAGRALASMDLSPIIGEDLVRRFDPVHAATEFLNRFNGRDRDLLNRILRKPLGTAPTLERLGEMHGITRERIRQLECRLIERLRLDLGTVEYESIAIRATEIGRMVGAAAPLDGLPPEVRPDETGLADELFMWLAGPYRLQGDWLVRHDITDLDALVLAAYEESADGYTAPLDALLDSLENRGLVRSHGSTLVSTTERVRVFGDHVVRWRHLRDRIGGMLTLHGSPMSADELIAAIGEVGNERSVLNHLSDSPEVKRIGIRTWALATWDGEEYTTIVGHMRERLAQAPLGLDALQQDLHRRFGISNTSVAMYASMHPGFVMDGQAVRLRRPDEPYIPRASLELTADCFVVDGAWAYAITVDRDLRRGSGRRIPESFAVHLGLHPGTSGEMFCGQRAIRFGWTSMQPSIGSLRWLAQLHELEDGDRIFIRRDTPSTLDVRFVRHTKLERATATERLMLLVGADASTDVEDRLERRMSEALGLGAATPPSITQLEARLTARGEHVLLDLVRQTTDT